MSAELILYSDPMSRGRVARWMLEELGQPYEIEYLGYDGAMKSPEYLAINPMGKVPALKHGDAIVTEVTAICAYPAARLQPETAPPGACGLSAVDVLRRGPGRGSGDRQGAWHAASAREEPSSATAGSTP